MPEAALLDLDFRSIILQPVDNDSMVGFVVVGRAAVDIVQAGTAGLAILVPRGLLGMRHDPAVDPSVADPLSPVHEFEIGPLCFVVVAQWGVIQFIPWIHDDAYFVPFFLPVCDLLVARFLNVPESGVKTIVFPL